MIGFNGVIMTENTDVGTEIISSALTRAKSEDDAHTTGYENTVSIDSGDAPIDSVSSISVQGNDISIVQNTEHEYPVEVTTDYAFTVDSKGLVKPEFKASIHRRVNSAAMVIHDNNYPHELIKKDAEFLVAYAQEILNKTPTFEQVGEMTEIKKKR
jgi:hypothetical protein